MNTFLFYAFCTVIVLGAAMAVTMRHLLHAALALMTSLFFSSGLFILLHAEFVALVLVMVYIGGVVIFIIYAILLTAHLGEEFPSVPAGKHIAAAVLALAVGAASWFLVSHAAALTTGIHDPHTIPGMSLGEPGSLRAVGVRLLESGPDGFVIPFEVISILMLAALIGAISIARRTTKQEEQSP